MPSSDNGTTSDINNLAKIADSYIRQNKWRLRWNNLIKIAIIIYIFSLTFTSFDKFNGTEIISSYSSAGIINLDGAIMPNLNTSADKFIPLLQEAFKDTSVKAIIIQANSPGGSPVQSDLIHAEIIRLKNIYKKPIYAVVEDICASGCYYIVSAADKIYANKNSILGSIGVRMDSFNFTGLMKKVGIENRSMTAGKHKTFINPFGPVDKEGRKFFQTHVLQKTHQTFIDTIKKGRGKRLKDNPELFTGLVWLAEESIENGLIDGLGDTGYVMRDIVKVENKHLFKPKQNFLENLLGQTSVKITQQITTYLNTMR